ncbi:hypothetical protein EVAR_82595_1 [Eumeta japonica]|uniref:Uncharacterized protein n=1 Tax=Eumeta variegata TaxID=151549 RepID=A0A4C1X2K2_EUMVA|nr:hypothetical protein EVAR_82595_1 [Eumeta japonica]
MFVSDLDPALGLDTSSDLCYDVLDEIAISSLEALEASQPKISTSGRIRGCRRVTALGAVTWATALNTRIKYALPTPAPAPPAPFLTYLDGKV